MSVKLNRQRLVVVLETMINIYDIKDLHLAHTITGTPRNPNGVCALVKKKKKKKKKKKTKKRNKQ